MEEIKESETSFRLLPPAAFIEMWARNMHESSETLDNYLNLILNDLKEDGGKRTIFSFITQTKNYTKSGKPEYIKNLFGKTFCSINCFKNRLRNGGLEKTADSLEILAPNSSGVGEIIYKAKNNNSGTFALYITK